MAIAFGGLAQLLAGMWEFRTGNTFGAVAFSSFGAFWISFFFLVSFNVAQLPAKEIDAALGLYLWMWGIFTGCCSCARSRRRGRCQLLFLLLTVTFILLGIGNSGASNEHHPRGRLRRYRDGARSRCTSPALTSCRPSTSAPCSRSASARGVPQKTPSQWDRARPARSGAFPRFDSEGDREWRLEIRRVMSDELERELAAMLEIERFDPPAEFAKHANCSDPAIYEQADADWQGWWVSQAERLHWFKKWDQVLDDSNPPFYKWFVGGQAERLLQLSGSSCRGGPGRSGRVSLAW